MAKSISVAAGTSETIRDGGACVLAVATQAVTAAARPNRNSLRAFAPSRLRDCDPVGDCEHHALRISNHRKNGPPMSAVTMPTGSSMGASTVREIRSQATRNAAPKPSEAGTTSR